MINSKQVWVSDDFDKLVRTLRDELSKRTRKTISYTKTTHLITELIKKTTVKPKPTINIITNSNKAGRKSFSFYDDSSINFP